jgi:hypothetical protein
MQVYTPKNFLMSYIGGDQSSDPIGNLNLARTTLTHLRAQFLRLGHQTTMDANNIANLQHMLNNTITQFNHNLQVIANLRNSFQQREQMITQAWRDETNAH